MAAAIGAPQKISSDAGASFKRSSGHQPLGSPVSGGASPRYDGLELACSAEGFDWDADGQGRKRTLSKFVDYINQHLVAITPARSPDALLDKGGDVRLYLHHCEADSEYALNLAQALQQRQLETLLPAFEGPDSDIKSFNGKQLAECDAVVLCWAKASEVWVRAEASGLRDWHQLGRKQQFFYRAVIAAPPPGQRKKASKLLFPRGDIDFVVDLSNNNIPTADLLDQLVPAARASVS